MWRRRSDPGDDPDTDVSISEDEDFDEGSSSYCVSLGGGNSQKRQDGIQVLFQLERLRGTPVSVDGGIAASMTRSDLQSQEGQGKHDDDVMRFGDNGGFSPSRKDDFPCNSGDEEIASDDEDEEYARLVSSINRGECPVSGSRKKEREEPISEDFKDDCDALQKVQDPAEKSEKFVAKTTEYPSADELEDFDEQHGNRSVLMLPTTTTFPGGHVRQSIADFLDGLQENTSLPEGNLMTGKKRKKVSCGGDIEREVTDTKFLDELMPDPIGSTSCSSGEESNHNTYNLPRSHHDRSTMTERFQEILDCSSLANVDSLYSVQKTSSSGIFGQLQRVIQSQKDADIEFLKMMQEGGYDKTFSDVLILSKQLDAKLTVCQCSLVGNQENPLSSQDLEANSCTRERTVIFSLRVCNSVDLEIGNLIRIYPPWLGVGLGNGHDHNQSMILCTYYSQDWGRFLGNPSNRVGQGCVPSLISILLPGLQALAGRWIAFADKDNNMTVVNPWLPEASTSRRCSIVLMNPFAASFRVVQNDFLMIRDGGHIHQDSRQSGFAELVYGIWNCAINDSEMKRNVACF
ncbi:hypothetical protein MLD38_033013 [Melastoma candidum]|uniref:Uncharacterized protein n=1 Tax=Melastoma candidum TaxID=119954 RepID=A0ACB9M7P1_9MYRT|nr:hypothetical protein MLD38_033013 [Melastoma candidum]